MGFRASSVVAVASLLLFLLVSGFLVATFLGGRGAGGVAQETSLFEAVAARALVVLVGAWTGVGVLAREDALLVVDFGFPDMSVSTRDLGSVVVARLLLHNKN